MASTKTLYFDESGFTGNNLLDNDQPLFIIASTDISPEFAKDILLSSFPAYRGEEYKFQKIWKSKTSREGLLDFSSNLMNLEENVFTWVMEKKFIALTKLVDFFIEPIFYKAGYDFYNKGYSWKYVNYMHFGLTEFSAPDLYDSIVLAYQRFSRNPSQEELKNLQQFFKALAKSIDNENSLFLEQISTGAELFENFHNLENFKGADEIQLTTMLALITYWRKKHDEDFIVVHDASSNFSRNKDRWDKISGSSVPKQLHRLGDGSFVEFPLRIVKTESVDSKENYSVQFCDILSGVVNKYCRINLETDSDDKLLLNQLGDAGLKDLKFDGTRFQPIFPDNMTPEKLDGLDVVDQMVNIING